MNKIAGLLIGFCLIGSLAPAQDFPSEFWHPGKMVLISGDTISGEIKYNIETDLVQINGEGRLMTYSSRKIFYFEIFDVTIENYRQFYSIPYDLKSNYKTPTLFEVIYEGKVTLLARESIVNETSHYNSYYWSGGTYTRQVLSYDYFILRKNGEIQYFSKKYRDLLDLLKDKQREIKEYIRKNNLKTDEKSDLARIFAYYNALLDG
jgi:hypothetical protein